jgi:hypothetical protein
VATPVGMTATTNKRPGHARVRESRNVPVATYARPGENGLVGGAASSAPPTRRTPAPIRALWFAAVSGIPLVVPLGLLARVGWGPLIAVDLTVSEVLVVPGRGIGVDILRALTVAGLPMARLLVLGPLAVSLAWRHPWRLIPLVVAVGGARRAAQPAAQK